MQSVKMNKNTIVCVSCDNFHCLMALGIKFYQNASIEMAAV